MFSRIVQMIIGNVFVLTLTIYIFRYLRTNIFHLNLPIFGFLWMFNATLYTFIFGIFGFLEPNTMTIVSLVGLVIIGIPILRDRHLAAAFLSNFISNLKIFRVKSRFAPLLRYRTIVVILLVAFALLQLGRIAFHVWYVPPYVHDIMTYHLPNVAEWVQKQQIYPIVTPVARSQWPATFEVFETWFVVFLHHDILIQLGGVFCYLIAIASVYAIGRILNFGNSLSVLIALLYAYTPSVAIHATSCKNDLSVAASYLFSMALILDLFKNGDRKTFPLRNRLMLLIMAFCFGFGSKAYSAFISPGLLLLFIVALVKNRFLRRFFCLFRERKMLSKTHIFLYSSLIIGSGIVGFYWYIRNYIVFDNPFYPADFKMFGHLIFGTGVTPDPGTSAQPSFSFNSMWMNSLNMVTVKILDQGRYYADLRNITGWGWFNFSCGILALFYCLIFGKGIRLLIICFILSLLLLFGWIFVDIWHMRFVHFFPSVFAIAFGTLIANLSNRWIKGLLIVFAVMSSLLNLVAVLNVGVFSKEDLKRLIALPALERSSAKATRGWYNSPHIKGDICEDVFNRVPKDEIIGYNVGKNDPIYPLYDSDFSRNLIYVPIKNKEFIDFMKQHNIHYLYAPDGEENWSAPYVGHQIGVTGGQMIAFLNVDGEYKDFKGGSLKAGEWQHLALTFDGKEAAAYINGEEVERVKREGKILFQGEPHFVIGERSVIAPGEPFEGIIDEVAMYNRVLTQEEIQRDMNEGIAVGTTQQDAALVCYYTFEEKEGLITKDSSGNGHDGTLVNGAKFTTHGKRGGAIRLNRKGYVDSGEHPSLRISQNVTLEAWIRVANPNPTQFVAGTCYSSLPYHGNPMIEKAVVEGTLTPIRGYLYALK